MKESYSESVGVRETGVWINHGAATGANVLDGYHLIDFPGADAPGNIETSPDGTLWSWTGQRLSRFQNSAWEAFEVGGVTDQGRVRRDDELRWIFTSMSATHLEAEVQVVGLDVNHCLILLPGQILEFEAAGRTSRVVLKSDSVGLGGFTSMRRGLRGDVLVTGQRGIGKLSIPDFGWSEYVRPPAGYVAFTEPFEAEDGELLVTGRGGPSGSAVLRLNGGRWETAYRGASADLKGWQGEEKTLWVQDGNRLLHCTAAGKALPVARAGPLFGKILSIRPDVGHRFWVGTSQGLARYAPPLWRSPPETAGFDDAVFAITEDQRGRLWFLSTYSLICLDGEKWESFPLPLDRKALIYTTNALVPLPDGTIAVRTYRTDLMTFDPERRQFSVIKHPAGRRLGVFAPRADGLLLLQTFPPEPASNPASEGFALETFDGREFRTILNPGTSSGVGGMRCLSAAHGSAGAYWAGSTTDLVVYKDGSIAHMGSAAGFTDPGAFSVTQLANGKLLAGGRDGLFEYDGKAFHRILHGLDRVRDITEGRDGSVWIASGTGIQRLRNDKQISYGTEDGLVSDVAYRVFEDTRGRIWAGTSLGISLLHPDADLDPPNTRISTDRNARDVPPGGRVSLAFSGIDKWKFTDAERLLFSWRIDRGKWSSFTSQTSAELDKLSRGAHRLEVRAMDRNGNIDPHPPSFNFSVLPAWYQTTGFKFSASSFTVIAGLAFFVALSKQRLLRRRKKLAADRQEIIGMIARREPLPDILQRIARAIAENQWGAIGGALYYEGGVQQYLSIPGPPVFIAHSNGRWTFEDGEKSGFGSGLAHGPTTDIRSGTQDLLGEMIAVFSRSARRTESDASTLQELSGAASAAIENARLYDLLQSANDQLEDRIRERTMELEVANKELEAFAYSVSHDLRAPLRHMDGFADLLRQNCYTKIDGQGQRYLDKISASAQRMGGLIDDLLAFSRLLRTDVSKTHVDLQSLQNEVRQELEPDFAGRKVSWIIGDLPVVYGDRPMLRQVFANLLSNAVKYTRDREEARIEIGCAGTTKMEATIFVRDNGTGFEMQYADKLFGVFQRLHGPEFEGTGVGLANVHRIVHRHGGRVWAEAEVDRGATFYVSLRLGEGTGYRSI